MTQPVPYRQVIDELLGIWDAHQGAGEVRMRADLSHVATGVLVRGLTAHAIASARGALTLYRASQPVAALPLIRAVMEDAVTAAWLVGTPEGWKSFLSDGAKKRRVILDEILKHEPGSAMAAETRDEMVVLADALGKITDGTIERRFAVIDPTGALYTTYRIGSTLIHAGPVLVDLYTEEVPNSPMGLGYREHASHTSTNGWLGAAASCLTHALTVWDQCQPARPDQAQLAAIAARLGVRSEFPIAERTR